MKVNVRGKGNSVKITDDIQSAVDKTAKKLERYVSDNAEMSVVIGVEGIRHTAELTLNDKNLFSRVEETGNDTFNVIHDAGEAMERKLRRYKEKLTSRYEGRPTTRTVAQRLGEAMSEDEDTEDTEDLEETNEIVRVKRFGIKPMFPEDAVLEMEMVDHDFFVFLNAEEDCNVNVIYRRKKGGYGLISPTVMQ
ncbi:MAG: ribosome-associated translation inhibitor RaiA [Lachnospiraceae bacterium]|nr:ribosome-associated translation inhibitor RaiA [Lachnospiraceae bacterium]